MTSALFSPIRLADLELANRIVVSPMCQYSADDGVATDWHLNHLGMLANSGAGAGRGRGDRHRAPWPHHSWLPRALFGRLRSGAGARRRPLPPLRQRQARHPARPCRAQGLRAASLGRRPAAQAGRRSLGDDCAIRHPVRPQLARAAGDDGGRHGARARRLRRGRRSARFAPASTPSNCTARTAICCTASSRRSPTSAATTMAARSRRACAIRSRSRKPCAR